MRYRGLRICSVLLAVIFVHIAVFSSGCGGAGATGTATSTDTLTSTNTGTGTLTSTSTGTSTSSGTSTLTGTSTSTGTGTLTGTSTGTSTYSGTGTLTDTGTATSSGSGTNTNTGTIEVTCTPASQTYSTGSVSSANVKTDGLLKLSNNATETDSRGWARFELSAISPYSTIRTVRVRYHVETLRTTPGSLGGRLMYKNVNPYTATGDKLYLIYDATIISDAMYCDPLGWHYIDFPPEAVELVQGSLNRGYITLLFAFC